MRDRRWRRPASGRGWRGRVFVVAIATTGAAHAAPLQAPFDADQVATSPAPEQSDPKQVREFTDGQGRLCRIYERAVVIGGEKQPAIAVVCREPNGRWVLSR
jgi:hypothetical protein